MAVNAIPSRYHSITPYLVVTDGAQVIEFMKEAFGAEHVGAPIRTPDGRLMHAEMKIGDSIVMVGEATGEWKAMPAMLYLYVPDTDTVYRRAVEAGATAVTPPENQFYGDRNAIVKDSAGNMWCIASHVEDVQPDEMNRRLQDRMQHA